MSNPGIVLALVTRAPVTTAAIAQAAIPNARYCPPVLRICTYRLSQTGNDSSLTGKILVRRASF
jgi:hypothetical protein